MNKVILIGRLTRDVEFSTTQSGISVAKFCIAVQRKFKNAAGENEADYINVVAWRGLADNCNRFLSKGKRIAVSGSLQTRSYDDKNGEKRFVVEVNAEDVEFISSNTTSDTGETAPSQSKKGKAATLDELTSTDEDLPF